MASDVVHRGGRPGLVRLAVSACLLGERVRYDGGDKRDSFIANVLSRHATLVPLCPEVGAGFGVPREPVELRAEATGVRMVARTTGRDLTPPMRAYLEKALHDLAAQNVSGVILKSKSPSCGPENVPVYARDGRAHNVGAGLYAAALAKRFPDLPVSDEHGLQDVTSRAEFMRRVCAYAREQVAPLQHAAIDAVEAALLATQ